MGAKIKILLKCLDQVIQANHTLGLSYRGKEVRIFKAYFIPGNDIQGYHYPQKKISVIKIF